MISRHRHDFSSCSCGKSSLDGGGTDLIRLGGKVLNLHTWDWTTQDNRHLKAEEITDEHYRNIINDGFRLRGRMKEVAMERGLLTIPIISFSGPAGSGKNAISAAIYRHAPTDWVEESWASPMKECVASVLGVSVEQLEAMKEGSDGPEVAAKVRKMLQLTGTDVFRDNWADDVWVKHLMRRIDSVYGRGVLVTDTRFPNELEALRDKGAFLVKVDCPEEYRRALRKPTRWWEKVLAWFGIMPKQHRTEVALDGYDDEFHFTICNDRSESLDVFAQKVLGAFELWREVG